MSAKSFHVETLSGLRGVAAMVVYVSHSANFGYLPEWMGEGLGQFGVMLFFMLSAYLMTALYYERPFHRDSVKAYGLARVGRVVPLYLLMVGISVAGFGYAIETWPELMQHLLFIEGEDVLWTIPVEMQFYVLFLVLWGVVSRIGPRLVLAGVICLWLVSYGMVATEVIGRSHILPFHLHYFLTGIVLARVTQTGEGPLARLKGTSAGMALSLLCGLAFVVMIPGLRDMWWGDEQNLWSDPFNFILLVAVFLLSLQGVGIFGYLTLRPLVFMGSISYGFYLIHLLVLEHTAGLFSGLPPVLAFLLAFAITSLIAWASLRYFEKPVLAWFRGLAKRPATKPAQVPTEAGRVDS